jgi:nitroimidazol reductase NimA-like FMN-containing flavoprotein (pyridoxamine 5'-phosphate oxidase superfamily)/GNAT superfamily N-acetyltransferase
MRKEIYRMSRDEAVAILAAAPYVHVAGTDADGRPIFRTLNAAVTGGAITFHGAPAGEKLEMIGREVVIAAEDVIASIPSWFVDPERACPATTYFRSVQVHGVLEEVTDPVAKALALAALMAKHQPEGKHVPIAADHPLYRKAIEGLLVARVSLEKLDGKGKLGQNRNAGDLAVILERLWERGAAGDARAIDLVRRANPQIVPPPFLISPPGTTLLCAPGHADLDEVVDLLRQAYWNEGLSREVIGGAQIDSTAWVAARDATGALVATARALSDGTKYAYVYDVMVAPVWRGRGLGAAVLRLLLDHPRVRRVPKVWLRTRDAMEFYRRYGFVEGGMPARVPGTTEMMLFRDAPTPVRR